MTGNAAFQGAMLLCSLLLEVVLLLLLLLLHGRRQIQQFLATHKVIETPGELSAFKALARHQMKLAAGAIPLGVGFVAAVYAHLPPLVLIDAAMPGASRGAVGALLVAHSVVVYGPCLAILGLGFSTKTLERRAQTLPVADALQDDHARVIASWRRKLFADF